MDDNKNITIRLNAILLKCQKMKDIEDDQILSMVELQLKCIISLLEGKSQDFSKLKDINLGTVAIRLFETIDSSFAKDLSYADDIAEGIKWRKIQLSSSSSHSHKI